MAQPVDFHAQIAELRAQFLAHVESLRAEGGWQLAEVLARNPHMIEAIIANHIENTVDEMEDE